MRRVEFLAASALAVASAAVAWAAPRPMPAAAALALPLAWGGLLLYVPFRVGAAWAWRWVKRAAPDAGDRRAFALVLLLAFGLLIWGLEWGLTDSSWAADELRPDWVRDLLHRGLGGGWYDKYPWLHYAVLAVPVSAFEVSDLLGILPADSVAAWAGQLALMRAVSVLMSLGTLVAAYLCSVELVGPRRAPLGPLALLLTPVFLYYGKTANVDAPALCWFGWAMVAFLRARRSNWAGYYVWFGIAAAGSVATKDQAYANLGLVAVVLVFLDARRQVAGPWPGKLGRALVSPRLWAAASAAVLASAVFHNALFNFSGFLSHVRLLATQGDQAIVPRNLAGYVDLTRLTVGLFRWSMGWPLFALAAAGIAGALAKADRRWWLLLLLVPLSFHLLFTSVVLWVYDRFLLGGTFVLALLAGAAAADALGSTRWRQAGRLVAAVSFIYALFYSSSINVMMSLDSRRAVKAWIAAATSAESVVGLVGRNYMPRVAPPAHAMVVEPSAAAVEQASPDLLVVNLRYAQRYERARAPDGRVLIQALRDGSLGYHVAFQYRARIPVWALLQYEAPFRAAGESPLTNLDKVNPEMAVYARRGREDRPRRPGSPEAATGHPSGGGGLALESQRLESPGSQ